MEKKKVNQAIDILVRIVLFPIMIPIFIIMTLAELFWIVKSWFCDEWYDMWR